MSGVQPIAFWGLKVPAGDELTMVASEIPGVNMFRITMAAIDPSAKPLEADQPKRATLKLIRRPLDHDDYEDDDDEDDEDESADEEELKKIQKKSKKLAKKGGSQEMDIGGDAEDSDEDEDEDDDDEEPFKTEEFVICTLDPERQYQQTLDIVVGEYEEAFFKVVGNFDVFLSGNYVVPADHDSRKDGEDDSEDEEDDDYDLSPDEDELMNMLHGDADSEDELDDIENPRITEIDSEDEKKKEIETKLTKAEKKSLKRAAEEEAKSEEPKLSKKQLKKLKANSGKAVETTQPETPESKKKVQFAKPIEQGPTNGQKDAKKTPEKAEKAEKASPAKRVVQGITIEDKKAGTGPVAKNGAKLGMRYIGKLNNGKVFDSNTKGKPFTFRLGKGEVIKGWDVGLVGMQVGGERRIIIPANMAYGKKQLPGIPANSTLTFDVKLLEVK